MIGWLALFFFVIAFITTALFVEGQKQLKNVIVVRLDNEPTFPKKTPDGYIEHKGKLTIGSGSWDVSGKFMTDPLVFYCQKDKTDYSNGNNCTLNPPYLQRSVRTNRDAMIACYVLGVFFLVLFVRSFMKKKQQTLPRQSSN